MEGTTQIEPAPSAPPAVRPTEAPAAARRVVFFMHSLGYLRFFDSVLRSLLDRGHEVHLLLERDDHEQNEREWLAEMEPHPRFTTSVTTALGTDRWRGVATRLRRSSDYLRFAGPAFRATPHLVARARGRAPKLFLRIADSRPFQSDRGRRMLLRAVLLLERAVPNSQSLRSELAALRPDVLVISPHLMPGGRHSEYLRGAHRLGIPTCVCVASWDNLSSKQLLREVPDQVVVWNETQRREAEEVHSIPAERVVVTGAQNFDVWFDWRPRPREEFCRRVGLDPDAAYVLYLGGSLFPGALTEAEWMRDHWLPAFRRDPHLGHMEVLARPHPSRMAEWKASGLRELEGVAVWPVGGDEMPVDRLSRADYYDSIHHSEAVVGLNTSAMIEAAIVGRSVLTVLVPEFAESQQGTFHFEYLLTVAGGLPLVARSLEEHLEQLRDAVAGRDADAAERSRRFIEAFVRPHGLERPATPLVVEAIERLADRGPTRRAAREWPFLPLRALLGAYIYSKAALWKLGRLREPRAGSRRAE